ncbi:MAG: FtsK/SpoIIIE domain-containing protein, partial [Phycisphaerae bacterium]
DFKKGVEFRTYAANQLPHARVVAIESDREFGLSVLERLDEILQERGELFRSYGVQDLPAFRKSRPTETMPRLLLLIDEFQVINRKVHLKGQDAVVSDAATIRYDSLQPPASSEYVRYVRAIGEASRGARRVEVSFARIAPREENIWTYSTAEGIDLPIGRAGAARLQTMKLGRGTSQHVLIAGKTGSGKSTLLHILITNMALHYSPNEIQFYLIDFKKGVEFRTYAANQLPHARVVAIESDREFGLS